MGYPANPAFGFFKRLWLVEMSCKEIGRAPFSSCEA